MAQERLANLGYGAIGEETTAGTAVAATEGFYFYDNTLKTDPSIQDLDPIYGNKFKYFASIPGQRKHSGDVTIYADPNTTSRFLNITLTAGSPSGSGPYTRVFTLGATTSSATLDFSDGNMVQRFFGVEASNVTPDVNDNEVRLKFTLSARGSWLGREVASVDGTTITLKTDYDPAPTKGLVDSDLIKFHLANGTTLDTIVSDITSGTVIEVAAATGVAAGDFVVLRAGTPSATVLDPFQWAKTEFRFGTTAAAALSATHTPVENDSTFELVHEFDQDGATHRSGSYDPTLVRKQGDASFSIKKFFDTPEDVKLLNSLGKTACVIRMFAGATNQYEMRITFNQLVTDNPLPELKTGEINYSQITYHLNYKSADGQAFSVTMLDGIASL